MLKREETLRIPGIDLGRLQTLWNPNRQRTFFTYGGYWKARLESPPGLVHNGLFGRSTNQEMINGSRRVNLQPGDWIFLRPTQSEFVFLQFGDIAVYDGGEIVEREKLLVATPEFLVRRFRLDVRTRNEVERIDLVAADPAAAGAVFDEVAGLVEAAGTARSRWLVQAQAAALGMVGLRPPRTAVRSAFEAGLRLGLADAQDAMFVQVWVEMWVAGDVGATLGLIDQLGDNVEKNPAWFAGAAPSAARPPRPTG